MSLFCFFNKTEFSEVIDDIVKNEPSLAITLLSSSTSLLSFFYNAGMGIYKYISLAYWLQAKFQKGEMLGGRLNCGESRVEVFSSCFWSLLVSVHHQGRATAVAKIELSEKPPEPHSCV